MADPQETSSWFAAGGALAGLLMGIGSVFGINKMRGDDHSREGDVLVSKDELEAVKKQVATQEVTLAQHSIFIETLKEINDSLKRIHKRLDDVDRKMARMEGYDAGVKSREL
jgi:hypothetical protein